MVFCFIITDVIQRLVQVSNKNNIVLSLCEAPSLMGKRIAQDIKILEGIELQEEIHNLTVYTKEKDFAEAFCRYGGAKALQELAVCADRRNLSQILSSVANLFEKDIIIPILEEFIAVLIRPDNFCNEEESNAIKIFLAIFSKGCNFPYLFNHHSSPLVDTLQAFIRNEALIKWIIENIINLPNERQTLYLQFINELLKDPCYFQQLLRVLDYCNARKTLLSLFWKSPTPTTISLVADFQGHVIRDYLKGIEKPVDSGIDSHLKILQEIFNLLPSSSDNERQEDIEKSVSAFDKVGVLGLATIHFFVNENQELFREVKSKLIQL